MDWVEFLLEQTATLAAIRGEMTTGKKEADIGEMSAPTQVTKPTYLSAGTNCENYCVQ